MLLLGVVTWIAVGLVLDIAEDMGRAEANMEKVYAAHGRVGDYVPPLNGAIPPERMEAFLQAREHMAPARAKTQGALELLSSQRPSMANVPGLLGRMLGWGMGALKIEAGRNLGPDVVAFFADHGEALLEAGMGPGEYLYIYSVAYYAGLGKSPADGPAFVLVSEDEGESQGVERDAFDVREIRREFVLRRLNERFAPMLRRQLEALEAEAGSDGSWHQRLGEEVAALENDRFRIPWRDGLPTALESSIAPYRARLEASYSTLCNPLEVRTGD